MASSKQGYNLEDELTCPVCLELFNNPVMLDCGHNFCRSCIDSIWVKENSPSCPECKEDSARKYIVNRVLNKLAEKALDSSLRQKDIKSNRDHSGDKTFCQEHMEKLKLFCKEDSTLICLICLDSPKHAGHSFLPQQDAVRLYKRQLKKSWSPLGCRLKKLKELQKKQEQKVSNIKKKARSFEHHIQSEFAKLKQFLHDREQRLIQQLKEEEAGILREMEENLKNITEDMNMIQNIMSDIQPLLEQEDFPDFVAGIRTLIEKLSEGSEEDDESVEEGAQDEGSEEHGSGGNKYEHDNSKSQDSEDTRCNSGLVTRDLTLGKFKGPLQYTIWKQMRPIISPVPSPLTLDPNTAHPELVLCKELIKVRHGNIRQQLPDNPERFDQCPCVLGSEGFTSGKHYWEVEVGNKTDWDVGVVGESINRKGQITLRTEDGFWTLLLRNGNEYVAVKSPSEVLSLSVRPQQIGVYLDYEGGQVSFYNADDMSHLCTFTDIFVERLYPYLSPLLNYGIQNKEQLKIFHLKL